MDKNQFPPPLKAHKNLHNHHSTKSEENEETTDSSELLLDKNTTDSNEIIVSNEESSKLPLYVLGAGALSIPLFFINGGKKSRNNVEAEEVTKLDRKQDDKALLELQQAQQKVAVAKEAAKALAAQIQALTADDQVFSQADSTAVASLKATAEQAKAAAERAVSALPNTESEKATLTTLLSGLETTLPKVNTPKPNAILTYKDDQGWNQDEHSDSLITNDKRPSFNVGTGLRDKSPKLYVNGDLFESNYDSSKGTLTPLHDLADGKYSISYSLTSDGEAESLLSDSFAIEIDSRIVSKIHYKNGELLINAGTSVVNFSDFKYEESINYQPSNSSPYKITKNSHHYEKYLKDLTKYIQDNGDSLINNIVKSYKVDSDNDGLIDIKDRTPDTWSVSNRDLRMFSSLAYSKSEQLDDIFNRKKDSTIKAINKEKFADHANVEELSKSWTLLHTYLDKTDKEGLDYAIFGNGLKADNSYKNIVIAFRGTNDSSDHPSNASIAIRTTPAQAYHLDEIANLVKKFNGEKIYTTGHSLGGYLAQYFAAYNIERTPELTDKFERSVLFNPAKIRGTFFTPELSRIAAKADNFTKISYQDDSGISRLKKTNSYVLKGEAVSELVGAYSGTTYLTGPKISGSHSMITFYENDPSLHRIFSMGYRIDDHYRYIDTDKDGLSDFDELRIGTNLSSQDTDDDGFSDSIEAKLESDALDPNSTPIVASLINIESFVSAINILEDGKEFSLGITMEGRIEGDKVLYTPSDTIEPINIDNPTEITYIPSGSILTNSILVGTDEDDILYTGQSNSQLTGKAGKDTFVIDQHTFSSSLIHKIMDFNSQEDKLSLESLRKILPNSQVSWEEIFVKSGGLIDDDRAYLIFNENDKTLSYKLPNAPSIQFLTFGNDMILNTENIIG